MAVTTTRVSTPSGHRFLDLSKDVSLEEYGSSELVAVSPDGSISGAYRRNLTIRPLELLPAVWRCEPDCVDPEPVRQL